MKKLVLLVILILLATLPSTGASGLDSEILLYPSSSAMEVGESVEVRVVVTVLHGYCPIELDDTIAQISSNATILSESEWGSLGSSRYERILTIRGDAVGVATLRVYRQCPKFGLLQKEVAITVTEPAVPQVEALLLASPDALSLAQGAMVEWTLTVQSSDDPRDAGIAIDMPGELHVVSEAPWVQKTATRYQKSYVFSGAYAGTGAIDVGLPSGEGGVQASFPVEVYASLTPSEEESLSILPSSLEIGLGETGMVTLVLSGSGPSCTTQSSTDVSLPAVLELEAEGPWTYDEETGTHTKQLEVSGTMGGSAELSATHSCEGASLSSLAQVTVLPYALNPLTDQEIFVDVSSVDLEIGEMASLTVAIKIIHSNCPLTIDDTKISLPPFLSLFSQTSWEQTASDLYEKTITVRADSDGSGYIAIVRNCPRYGILDKQIPAAAGSGELPGGSAVQEDMPLFDWAAMKNLSLFDVADMYGVDATSIAESVGGDVTTSMTLHDIKNATGITKYEIQALLEDAYADKQGFVYDVPEPARFSFTFLLQDYVYIAMVSLAIVLFALRRYRLRLAMLGASLIYFGFYLKGCMCQLGVFANFFIFDTIELHWVILLMVPVVSTLLAGRSFCGWVCFFGTIQEYLYEARARVLPIKTRRKLPQWLSYSKFVVLGLIIYFAVVSSRVVFCDYDPFFYIIYRIFSLDTLGVLTILLVVGSLFIERPFCRYACPMGAVLMAADAVALNRVRVEKGSCNGCTLCNRVCPMGRDLVTGKGECINCGKCFDACRKDAIYYGKKRKGA